MNPQFSPSSFSETPESLFVRKYGHGDETFVMLHGLSRDGSSWEPVIKHMDLKKNRFLCPDLLGHGQSSYTPYLKYAPSTHAYFLERDVISKITMNKSPNNSHFKPFHLVGFDLGAVLAVDLALKNPSHIKSLTLISPPIYTSEGEAEDDLLAHVLHPSLRIPFLSRAVFTAISQYDEIFKQYLEDPNFSPQKIESAKKLQAQFSSIVECYVKYRTDQALQLLYEQDNDFNIVMGDCEPRRDVKKIKLIAESLSPNAHLTFIQDAKRSILKTHNKEIAHYIQEVTLNDDDTSNKNH